MQYKKEDTKDKKEVKYEERDRYSVGSWHLETENLKIILVHSIALGQTASVAIAHPTST